MKIYLASNNRGKINEMEKIFPDAEVVRQSNVMYFKEPEETGFCFRDNAEIKAKALYKAVQRKMESEDIIIADDSGIIIPKLGENRLGVFTKRQMTDWVSENNSEEREFWKHIVDEAGEGSKAIFRTVIMVYKNCNGQGQPMSVQYDIEGTIVYPRGENGFGFDPIFLHEGKTLAEMSQEEKQKVNPRAKALRHIGKIFSI